MVTKSEFLDSLDRLECTICYEPYDSSHAPIKLACGHVFGDHCIVTFAETKTPNNHTCPMCRHELFVQEDFDEMGSPVHVGDMYGRYVADEEELWQYTPYSEPEEDEEHRELWASGVPLTQHQRNQLSSVFGLTRAQRDAAAVLMVRELAAITHEGILIVGDDQEANFPPTRHVYSDVQFLPVDQAAEWVDAILGYPARQVNGVSRDPMDDGTVYDLDMGDEKVDETVEQLLLPEERDAVAALEQLRRGRSDTGGEHVSFNEPENFVPPQDVQNSAPGRWTFEPDHPLPRRTESYIAQLRSVGYSIASGSPTPSLVHREPDAPFFRRMGEDDDADTIDLDTSGRSNLHVAITWDVPDTNSESDRESDMDVIDDEDVDMDDASDADFEPDDDDSDSDHENDDQWRAKSRPGDVVYTPPARRSHA